MVSLRTLKCFPLTRERWPDLETLFDENKTCRLCWCMWWRVKNAEFERQKGQGNKKALKKIIHSGKVPGILAYAGDEAIGWCSLGPREEFGRLERSPWLRRVDSEPVWSIVCFFVAERFRQRGVMERLLKAAVEYAGRQGARIVEAYPVDAKSSIRPELAYTGIAEVFRQAGFAEVLRRSETRPVMRYCIGTK
jgi:GNAT superfamily N-acetyltransferase